MKAIEKLTLFASLALAAAASPASYASAPSYARQTPGAGVKPNPAKARRRAANKVARKARKAGRQ